MVAVLKSGSTLVGFIMLKSIVFFGLMWKPRPKSSEVLFNRMKSLGG